MIEKLKIIEDGEIDMSIGAVNTRFEDTELVRKINELVDAVNNLQTSNTHIQKDLFEMRHPEAKENVDLYAEQRRWIRKLCHFWNKTEYTDDIYGFLTDIVPTNKYKAEDNYFVPFKDEFGSFYEHCEPVKPDDDIIFKGGDND